MIIFSVTAQIATVALKLVAMFFRCLDSGCKCDGRTTKKLTKSNYIKTYVGPYFDIGTRYSEVLLYYSY